MFQKRGSNYIPKHGAHPRRAGRSLRELLAPASWVKRQHENIFKKFIAMVLAFALAFGTVPITAAASPMAVTFVSVMYEATGGIAPLTG